MTNVLTFKPKPRPAAPEAEPLTKADLRTVLEEIGERVITLLDQMDGDADLEPDADAEPSLGAPENHHGSQIVWTRGGDTDGEAEVPETVLPEVIHSPVPRVQNAPTPVHAPAPLPWGGNGNVVSAAGAVLFALMAGEA